MSLILVPGASGSGKSHMMFQRVLHEAQAHPKKRYIVLVPEQNTLQTQKALVSMSARGGIWNIDVLSFTRLAYRVFEQTGVKRRQVLSDTGKVLLLRMIAARENGKIPILSGIVDRPGSLSEMKSILSEMDQYGIGPDRLRGMERMVQKGGKYPALERKLSEIALLQEAFERYQEDRFITGEKLPLVLNEKAPFDDTLKGAEFYLDGFTGLTPAQLKVITTLLGIAKDIMVNVTIDPEEVPDSGIRRMHPTDHELFALSKRTILSLIRCADEAHVPVQILPVPADGPGRHAAGGELWHLERHLLRPGRRGTAPYRPAADASADPEAAPSAARDCDMSAARDCDMAAARDCDMSAAPDCDTSAAPQSGDSLHGSGRKGHEIVLRQCTDPWDEAVSAAVTIEELIRQGVRYREIAVVCGSLPDYAEYVRRVLAVYEIPCYIDRSRSVVMNPAFEFVRCAIDIMEKNFSYESVMALLRTGLALEDDNIDLLENYLLAAGIRGRQMWSKPFRRKTRDKNQALLDAAQGCRAAFMERFSPFAEVMKKGKAHFSEYAGALRELLTAFGLPGKLHELSIRCAEEGRDDRAQEYAQVMKVISSVLDEAVLLMGEEEVSRTQFAQILAAGFSEAKIGILPRGIDQVQVADMERSRLEQIRVVLFLGMNDGFVPRRKAPGGVLTDMEREYLRAGDMHLAPTAKEEANIQQFYLYLTLTKPSQALYLSWSCAKRTGEELRPSGVLRNIRAMFPCAAWGRAASASVFESVTSLRTGRRALSRSLSDYLYADRETAEEMEAKLKELIRFVRRPEDPGHMLAHLHKLAGTRGMPHLDEQTAQKLYGMVMQGSVTRLETFSECAFRHFAQYGLVLKEREEYTIRPLEIGNLLHHAVELFAGRMHDTSCPSTWRSITDSELDQLAGDCLDQALSDAHATELYADTRRSEETLERCRRILIRSVRTIRAQIRAGMFEPAFFELSFGRGDRESVWIDALPGGRKMKLSGKIDRIDECEDTGEKRLYIKVMDYKSSGRDIDLDSLIDGKQMQLAVYLDAAAALEQKANPDKEIVCAGAFYFSFDDPIINMDVSMSDSDVEDAIIENMRVQGLVNSRPDVIERLDAGLKESGRSLVIPVTRNKNGNELRSSEHVITDRQFHLLRNYVRDRMRRIAVSILEGEIAPNPSRTDSRSTTCTMCPYLDVCRFDPHQKGMAYREKPCRTKEEKWEIIAQAVSDPGEDMDSQDD